MTAVHGKVPIKAPTAQCHRLTPQTPQAILMPDHGTTPISRSTLSRAQGEDEDEVEVEAGPSSAERVREIAEGKKRVKRGVRGVARMVESTDPSVVSNVWRRVAGSGGRSVPVKMFYPKAINIQTSTSWLKLLTSKTLPGMLQACFQRAVTAKTARTWTSSQWPVSE